jgi:hypothetical protein
MNKIAEVFAWYNKPEQVLKLLFNSKSFQFLMSFSELFELGLVEYVNDVPMLLVEIVETELDQLDHIHN